jgi:CRISPR-associated protein Cmr3
MSQQSMSQTWTFKPLDTWFFKQALAPDSLAAQELTSLFPPSPRTLIGAIRSAVGESNGVDWASYRSGKQANIETLIGQHSEAVPPNAQFAGVFVAKDGQRYYPMPLNWLGKVSKQEKDAKGNERKEYQLFKMQPSEQTIHCDLGRVRLPVLLEEDSSKTAGAKPLDTMFISAKKLEALLKSTKAQETLTAEEYLDRSSLITEEARLGIARNNATRKTEEGKLYQTKHLRLAEGISLQLDCKGWQATADNALMTLGGEGRLAQINVNSAHALPEIKAVQAQGIILTLTTPAKFTHGWLPDDFTAIHQDGVDAWQGTINGITLTLHSATIGKAHREGGWNIEKRSARDVESFVPAGSSYYCSFEGDLNTAIKALHLHQIGHYTTLGRGQLVVGIY